ncbi:MAG: hypothetical protein PHN79_07630 [Methanoregula sp.]|nr:hypothetical protein [Methanoregula sp.]
MKHPGSYLFSSSSPVVRPIPLLSGVRLRMSVVVASRRCERLTQE